MGSASSSAACSSTERGNDFRDVVVSHLAAAGFACQSEVRAGFKKADGAALWTRDTLDGPTRYLIETKDYGRTLGLDECTAFNTQYGELVRRGEADRAWLISRDAISPDGRALIDGTRGLRCFTFEEFQRTIMNVDGYLRDLIAIYEQREIERFYVPPHTEEDAPLEAIVRAWIEEPRPEPLAVISGYGKGKSTFALHLAAQMAREALEDKTRRVPILIELGDVIDVTGIDGLVARVLGRNHRAGDYHFHTFAELNRSGRFIVILDGFDEMKHGMTITMFERAFAELMKFDDGDARLLILGRDTAFHNDTEFNAIVLGRQRTALGSEIQAADRRRCRPVSLREFNAEEVASYVRRYFPLRVERVRSELALDRAWIEKRIEELLAPEFADLIIRPVHAQMLCEVATDPEFALANMTKLRLYDAFVHYLLHREIRKGGRDPRISLEARRRYNAGVAWWLWEKGGATTASLDSIPSALALEATQDLQTDYDAIGLQRELAAGLLVEKGETALYFAHRSIQEFLVAENLLTRGLFSPSDRGDPSAILHLLNAEIIDFMALYFAATADSRAKALNWINAVDGIRGKIPAADLALPARLARERGLANEVYLSSPWMYLLGFFVLQENTDFDVNPQRRGAIVEHLEAGWGNAATLEATLTLMAHVLLRDPAAFGQSLPRIMAAWLPATALARHVAEAGRGKSALAQVRREDDFRLWAFLQLVDVVDIDGQVGLAIDAPALIAKVKQQAIGFADPLSAAGDVSLQTTVQGLYRALDARDVKPGTIEDIRPFFNDPELRSRVRPLIVEHRNNSAQRRPAGARPKIGQPEQS